MRRPLPLLYVGLGHVCLLTAFGAVAMAPASVAGFYYHPRMLAVVHLVTLGWITASILGALYMILPMALRSRLPVRRADYWVFGGYALGATGMASHFWIDEPIGMVWAAGLAAATALWVAGRAAAALRPARIPAEVKAHFHLAFLNLLLAGSLGVAVGVDKVRELLPGASLDHVLAHAHLAALGWATMTVMAAGYRLLPMMLPAAAPTGPWVWAGALLMQTGVLGVSYSLYSGRGRSAPFAALCVLALVAFLSRIGWMLRHRRPASAALGRPEPGRLHVAAAVAWLIVAAVLGMAMAATPAGAWKLDAALAYGAAGLVGFLSQMVVGVAGRFVPLWVWLDTFGGVLHERRPPSPYDLTDRRLQGLVLALWTAGVPLLVAGLAFARHGALRAGAAALAVAAGVGLGQLGLMLRAARPWRSPPLSASSASSPPVARARSAQNRVQRPAGRRSR